MDEPQCVLHAQESRDSAGGDLLDAITDRQEGRGQVFLEQQVGGQSLSDTEDLRGAIGMKRLVARRADAVPGVAPERLGCSPKDGRGCYTVAGESEYVRVLTSLPRAEADDHGELSSDSIDS